MRFKSGVTVLVFRMSLPLTLAIIDGMVIRVGPETYVLPTISIIRSVKPAEADIATVFQQGEMLRLQGDLIPLYRMSQIYGIRAAREKLTDAIVVVVESHAGMISPGPTVRIASERLAMMSGPGVGVAHPATRPPKSFHQCTLRGLQSLFSARRAAEAREGRLWAEGSPAK